MKYVLLALCLLAASAVRAQEAPKGAATVVIHMPDSARVAYTRVVRALVAAGYGVATNDVTALFASTPPKALPEGGVTLTLRTAAVPTPGGGSDVLLTGVFTWYSVFSIMAQGTQQLYPAQAVGGPSTPVRRSWNEMVRVAGLLAPGAPLAYR